MKLIELSKKGTVNKGKYFAKVDDDIFEEVDKYGWTYNNYARNTNMNIYLHVYIWKLKYGEVPSGFEVEHINQDKLDCRLENLRLATRSENMCNIGKRKNNKSGFKGIFKEVQKGHRRKDGTYKIFENWHAEIRKDYGEKTEKIYKKRFPYTDEGFEQAKEWIKNMSLDVQGEYSIYNREDEDK